MDAQQKAQFLTYLKQEITFMLMGTSEVLGYKILPANTPGRMRILVSINTPKMSGGKFSGMSEISLETDQANFPGLMDLFKSFQ